ncbi:MAG: preprotein translocase subunit SecA [Elusimicrobia bacterium]|nr:preprotein translocase subunit SecA [Elusimicrobiota bacterium]
MLIENILKIFLGTQNERTIKKIEPIVELVNSFSAAVGSLDDAGLRAKTDEFKKRLADGKTLDDILPEAFAVAREAAQRTIRLRPYDVQIVGSVVLHEGKIAEMKTGEGKTLVAVLPVYLNALAGKGVHVVTVNDYLARRDQQWMGPVYEFLGLTVGFVQHDMPNEDRRAAYACDVTYVTNNEIGFDYLRDNLVRDKSARVLRPAHYAIVDEVDSILVDEARTPLIISGPGEASSQRYQIVNRLIPQLKGRMITEDEEIKAKYNGADLSTGFDFIVDEKAHTATLTDAGIGKCERLLGVKSLYDDISGEWVHHITQAIRAHNLYQKDVDYVVKEGEVIIVDEFTGRLMPGRRWSDGLHQAVEAKEGMRVAEENQTLATITFQNFFKQYKKLAGMTGTALTEAKEFWEIYKLDVVAIPPNRVVTRVDHPDRVYRTEREKFEAIVEELEDCWRRGQPVLVGTRSIEKSERLSGMLRRIGIPHNVLNAKYHEQEAQIIAQAGRRGAVTIATNMAGRGTDIVLGGNPPDEEQAGIVKRGSILFGLGDFNIFEFEKMLKKPRPVDKRLLDQMGVDAAGYSKKKERDVVRALNGLLDDPDFAKSLGLSSPPDGVSEDLWRTVRDQRESGGAVSSEELREFNRKILESFFDPTLMARERKGGLHILGTERHESRRIDNQLRGRAGRQGDPGSSRFYLALDDELMRLFGNTERIQSWMGKLGMQEGENIEHGMVTRAIGHAQSKVEAMNFDIRKQLLDFDKVMSKQREAVYSLRNAVLDGENMTDRLESMMEESLDEKLALWAPAKAHPEEWDFQSLGAWLTRGFETDVQFDVSRYGNPADLKEELLEVLQKAFKQRELDLGTEMFQHLSRMVLLQVMDTAWVEHLTYLEQLRKGIFLRAYGQKDPLIEFQKEGFSLFETMMQRVREESLEFLFRIEAAPAAQPRDRVMKTEKPSAPMIQAATEPAVPEPPSVSPLIRTVGASSPRRLAGAPSVSSLPEVHKIGRNDPCPCGSGKKHKKCCGL